MCNIAKQNLIRIFKLAEFRNTKVLHHAFFTFINPCLIHRKLATCLSWSLISILLLIIWESPANHAEMISGLNSSYFLFFTCVHHFVRFPYQATCCQLKFSRLNLWCSSFTALLVHSLEKLICICINKSISNPWFCTVINHLYFTSLFTFFLLYETFSSYFPWKRLTMFNLYSAPKISQQCGLFII